MVEIRNLKKLFLQGENIINILTNAGHPREDAILLSYDLQAGSYTEKFSQNRLVYEIYTDEIASVITRHVNLDLIQSVVDIGTGEGTVLAEIIRKIPFKQDVSISAVDISFSRLLWAKKNLDPSVKLICGSLFKTPFENNFSDLILTVHSLEPNGGREFEALSEIWRISNRYLICFEPDYDSADNKGKQRMIKHGYIQSLFPEINKLENCQIVATGLLENPINPFNPTRYYILERTNPKLDASSRFISPKTGKKLIECEGLYTDEQHEVFPIVQGVSLMRERDSIIAFSCNLLQ